MTVKVAKNLSMLGLILALFPLIWGYNQKLHYRKFFSFDNSFLLKSTDTDSSQLSSPNELLRLLNVADVSVSFSYEVTYSPTFKTLGRTISTANGDLVVYQYESNKYAVKAQQEAVVDPLVSADIYIYKNLLITNVSINSELTKLVQGLYD